MPDTFHGVPSKAAIRVWRDQVPSAFRFAFRAPRRITHDDRLADTGEALERFLERLAPLGAGVGPVLFQLSLGFPPDRANRDRLAAFVSRLPPGFDFAVEVRHPAWLTPETSALLASRNVALAAVDGRWIKRKVMLELARQPTADFAYLRWNGEGARFADFRESRLDRRRELEEWAGVVRELTPRVRRVFGYFGNRYQGHAPESASAMRTLLDPATLAVPAPRG